MKLGQNFVHFFGNEQILLRFTDLYYQFSFITRYLYFKVLTLGFLANRPLAYLSGPPIETARNIYFETLNAPLHSVI